MIEVGVSEATIKKINTILVGVKDADKKVLKPALTRGLMAGKTAASREVRQTYHISAGDFSSKGRINYNNVSMSGNGIVGSILYSGAVIPLMKFKVTPSTPKRGKTPSAAVMKANSLTSFSNEKNVFVAQMKSGHVGMFERRAGVHAIKGRTGQNKHSEKLKELYSPAIPTMVGNEKVMKAVEDRVNEVINQRIDHEINRILNKYGG